MIGSSIEAVCGINNIKISGSQQLATDIGYGRDAGDEGRYTMGTTSGDEALILQRVARLRGALAC